MIRKPGSVLADHLSSHDVATVIERITHDGLWREPEPYGSIIHPLAADRVYLFTTSPM
jgi:hypothetical protein